jgi:hypothetical protein
MLRAAIATTSEQRLEVQTLISDPQLPGMGYDIVVESGNAPLGPAGPEPPKASGEHG